jgi:hypothetical protein
MCLRILQRLPDEVRISAGRWTGRAGSGCRSPFKDESFPPGVVEAAQLPYFLAELSGGVLGSAVGVDHATGFQGAQVRGHVEGDDDKVDAMAIGQSGRRSRVSRGPANGGVEQA